MNSLRILGALVIGALVLAALYGASFGDRGASADFDIDDGEGGRHVVSGDKGEFSLHRDGLKIKASWRGDYALNANGDGIATLDHKMEIQREKDGDDERVVFEQSKGGVASAYFLNGEEQSDSEEATIAASDLFVAFLRASGAKAEARTKLMLANADADAVIKEIASQDIDHTRRRYAAALTEQTDLSPAQLRTLLTEMKDIASGTDLRSALGAIFENETVGTEQIPLFLEAAQGIDGDYDMRRLIETFAERPLSDDAMTLAISLIEDIESDHDLRRASEALLAEKTLSPQNAARILSTAGGHIESDHDLRLILSDAAGFLAKGAAPADAWLNAFDGLASSHDQRRALESAVASGEIPTKVRAALLEKIQAIDSDHDRRLALELFADDAVGDPALLAAYRTAASEIASDYDRRLAMEAVGVTPDD